MRHDTKCAETRTGSAGFLRFPFPSLVFPALFWAQLEKTGNRNSTGVAEDAHGGRAVC